MYIIIFKGKFKSNFEIINLCNPVLIVMAWVELVLAVGPELMAVSTLIIGALFDLFRVQPLVVIGMHMAGGGSTSIPRPANTWYNDDTRSMNITQTLLSLVSVNLNHKHNFKTLHLINDHDC